MNNTTGWYEMFFRGYDPATARMLQVDPFATVYASHNPYNYSLNNPVMLNDPSGGLTPAQVNSAVNSATPISQHMANIYADWGEDWGMNMFGMGSVSGSQTAAEAYAKYGVSIFSKNYNYNAGKKNPTNYGTSYYYLVLGENGTNYGYDVITDLLGIVRYLARGKVKKNGDGWELAGSITTLYDDHNIEVAGGGINDWMGLTNDAADDVFKAVANNYTRLQAEVNLIKASGISYAKELSRVQKISRALGWTSKLLGVYNAFSIESKYNDYQISKWNRTVEHMSNVFTVLGGQAGAGWGIGWEVGRWITSFRSYQDWKHDTWLPWRTENFGY